MKLRNTDACCTCDHPDITSAQDETISACRSCGTVERSLIPVDTTEEDAA